ncbi:MAG: hypothetical protein R3Y36_00390 [Spirochaetales bacterium]
MIDYESVAGKIDRLIRKKKVPFSLQMLQKQLDNAGFAVPTYMLEDYLQTHPLIFEKENGLYVSRAAVFTDKIFSIKPTKSEISAGILITGHRCIPFVDPELSPHEITFISIDRKLKKTVAKLSLDDVFTTHNLYGEEFIPQYMAEDPANQLYDYKSEESLFAQSFDVTVWDMKDYYQNLNFSYGDRLIARVVDWDLGTVEIFPKKAQKATPFEVTEDDELRNEWFSDFEKILENGIETYGPLLNIEEQLAYAFFEYTDKLCTPFCASVEEYILQNRTIGIESYGVESRLWKSGEEIPALNFWNDSKRFDLADTLYSEIGLPIPTFMLDVYILDAIYLKEKELQNITRRLIPETYKAEENQIKKIATRIKSRYNVILQNYDRFSEFNKGPLRNNTLTLYSKLVGLTCELDACAAKINTFPQQPLIMLGQIFSHTTQFLQSLLYDGPIPDEDMPFMYSSLEGMTASFEDVEDELLIIIQDKQKDSLKIIQ